MGKKAQETTKQEPKAQVQPTFGDLLGNLGEPIDKLADAVNMAMNADGDEAREAALKGIDESLGTVEAAVKAIRSETNRALGRKQRAANGSTTIQRRNALARAMGRESHGWDVAWDAGTKPETPKHASREASRIVEGKAVKHSFTVAFEPEGWSMHRDGDKVAEGPYRLGAIDELDKAFATANASH